MRLRYLLQVGQARGDEYRTEDGQRYVLRRIKDYEQSPVRNTGTADPDEGRKSEVKPPVKPPKDAKP